MRALSGRVRRLETRAGFGPDPLRVVVISTFGGEGDDLKLEIGMINQGGLSLSRENNETEADFFARFETEFANGRSRACQVQTRPST